MFIFKIHELLTLDMYIWLTRNGTFVNEFYKTEATHISYK